MLLRRTVLPILSAIALIPAPMLAQSVPAGVITRPQAAQNSSSSIANFLPENTSGVVLIKTDNALWQDLSRFAIFPKNMSFPGWLYSPGANFDKDVRPWLGDQIGFAILPATANRKLDRSVTIASVKDASKVNRFLEQVKMTRKTAPMTRQYKGITILEWKPEKLTPPKKAPSTKVPSTKAGPSKAPKPSPSPAPVPLVLFTGFAIAVLPNQVITASSAEPIQQLIDAQAVGKPLANNPLFQRTIQNPKYQKSLLVGYGNYLEVVKALDTFNQSQLEKLPPNTPKPPKLDYEKLDVLGSYYDTMDGYIWADANGIRVNAGIHFKKTVPESVIQSLKTKNEILERLPEITYATSNSQNLAMYWKVLSLGLESEPTFKKQIDQFRQFAQKSFGVDDRDLLPWMDKEIATFIYPTRQGVLPSAVPNLDIGFGLMVQTSDRTAAETALKKIDQQFKKNKLSPSINPSNAFTSFKVPIAGKPQDALSHGWVSPDTLLILAGGGSSNEFSPKPIRTLPKSVNFQNAIAALRDIDGTAPASNLGYFYVNGGAIGSLINTALLPLIFGASGANNPFVDGVRTTVGNIRSVSGSSGVTTEKVQTDAFLGLAPMLDRGGVKSPKKP